MEKINLKNDFNNKLLKRREIEFLMSAGKSPSFEDVKKVIADNFKAADDVIVIDRIKGNFGSDKFLIEAIIYDSAEVKKSFEIKKKSKEAKK